MSTVRLAVRAENVHRVVDWVGSATSTMGLMMFMRSYVSPYLSDQIRDRFAHEDDGVTPWLPLAESTIRIRDALGYTPDDINERSGQMLRVLSHRAYHDIQGLPEGARLVLPREGLSASVEDKIRHAQEGTVQGASDMIPGAATPPRPVLNLTTGDAAAITIMLRDFVTRFVQIENIVASP